MTNQDRRFRIHTRYLKIFLISSLLAVTSLLTTAQVKIKVYHCSLDGEKYDKKVTPEDSKIIKDAIKAWEAFDYKKALFETFLPVKRSITREELLPKQGAPGTSIDNDDCRNLFGYLTGEGLYCSSGINKLKLTEKETKIAFPDTKTHRYLALEKPNGKSIWKRKSPVWEGRALWELPVLPMPSEVGICFFDCEETFRIPVLYVLDIKTGKTILTFKLSSEGDFGGYLPLTNRKWDFKPFYKDGFIVYKPFFEGSEYFQNKFKDTPLVVIDVRPLLEN